MKNNIKEIGYYEETISNMDKLTNIQKDNLYMNIPGSLLLKTMKDIKDESHVLHEHILVNYDNFHNNNNNDTIDVFKQLFQPPSSQSDLYHIVLVGENDNGGILKHYIEWTNIKEEFEPFVLLDGLMFNNMATAILSKIQYLKLRNIYVIPSSKYTNPNTIYYFTTTTQI